MLRSHKQNKPSKMARTLSKEIYSQKMYTKEEDILHEPLALRIMREMEVVPLEDTLSSDESLLPSVRVPPKKLRKTLNVEKKTVNLSSGRSQTKTSVRPHLVELSDDIVLFRKLNLSQPSGEDPFAKLSDEIILHIFKWLPKTILVKCSQVCKRWRNLSYDETLWRRFDLGRKFIKPGVLGTLLSRGVSVLRLAMSEIKPPVFDDYFQDNSNEFCHLQYLDLSMAIIPVKELSYLLAVCNKLKKLSLENCPLDEDCCSYIAQNNDLKVLNMAMCSGLTPEGLYEISISCVKLREWNLAWTNLGSMYFGAFVDFIPKSLTRLNLSGQRESLFDQALITVIKRCSNLIELDISDCMMLSRVSFEELIKNCPKLEHLHMSRASNIPTECLKLLKDLKNFKNLEIFKTLPEESLASLREYLPNVKINDNLFSTIARPTVGIRRTSIWGLRVRD